MFVGDDLIEVDHRISKQDGGADKFDNLQPLHRHCHDVKTARDIDSLVVGADDNSRIVEEPCAVKVASTVLKGRVVGQPATRP